MSGQIYKRLKHSSKKYIQIVCCREIDIGEEIHYDYKGEYMPMRTVMQNFKLTARKEFSNLPTLDVSKSRFSTSELPTSTAPPMERKNPPF